MKKKIADMKQHLTLTPVDFDPFARDERMPASTESLYLDKQGNNIIFPLTEAQREIWFMSQMGDVASCAYNESFMLTLRGPFDLEAMCQAVQEVYLRHEAFHLRFSPEGDYQRKTTPTAIDIPFRDFSTLDGEGKEAKFIPFDFISKEFTLLSSWVNPYTFPRALKILASGKIDLKILISKRLKLDNIIKGFDLMIEKPKGFMKALVST